MPDYYIVEGFEDGHIAVREVGTDRTVMIFNGANKEEQAEKFIRYGRSEPEAAVTSDKSGPGTLLEFVAVLLVLMAGLLVLSDYILLIPSALLTALVLFAFGQLLHYVKEIRNLLQREERRKIGKQSGPNPISPHASIRRVHKDAA